MDNCSGTVGGASSDSPSISVINHFTREHLIRSPHDDADQHRLRRRSVLPERPGQRAVIKNGAKWRCPVRACEPEEGRKGSRKRSAKACGAPTRVLAQPSCPRPKKLSRAMASFFTWLLLPNLPHWLPFSPPHLQNLPVLTSPGGKAVNSSPNVQPRGESTAGTAHHLFVLTTLNYGQ